MPERLFINVDNPHIKRDHDSIRTVRSWVTKVQHARWPRRRLDTESPEASKEQREEHESQHAQITTTETPGSSTDASAVITPGIAWSWESVDPTSGPSPTTRRRIQAHVARRQHEKRRELKRVKGAALDSTSTTSSTFTFPLTTPVLEGLPEASLSAGLQDPGDTLGVYARQLNTSVPTIWHHYLWQEREHGRAFGEHYPEFQGWGPKYLHPLIISNRAFLATTVLFTGAHLRFLQGHRSLSSAILQLRSLAHEFVQAAINSELEQLKDSTMLSVVKLALFEAMFGVKAACQIHMQAVARMVQLRQGLLNLGMEGYTARLLVWFDANLSDIMGSPRCLLDAVAKAPIMGPAQSNEQTFRLGVDVRTDFETS